MLVSRDEAHSPHARKALFPLSRFHKRIKPHTQRPRASAFVWSAFLPLIIISGLLINWVFSAQLVFAAPLAPTAKSGHLTFAQYAQQGQQNKASGSVFVRPPEEKQKAPHAQNASLPSAEPASMQPITQTLTSDQTASAMVQNSSVKPLDFRGSDGRFEVQVAPGTFDLSGARTSAGAAPSGTLTLRISQVEGHSAGLVNLLGQYQIQLLDSQDKPLTHIHLRVPLTIIYHYQMGEMQALDLNPDHIFLSWPGLIAADKQAKTSTASDVVQFTNDAATDTLTAQTTVIDATANISVGSEPDNQSVPTPHFSSVQGNSGNLSYAYPLQIAPGSAGFAPDLQLAYSSGDPNGRHSQVSPSDDAGDGWSVSLGSITESTQFDPSGTSATVVYSISGVDKVSDRLIPDPANSGFFLTEHISHLRIHQLTSGTTGQPCFHVWDTSGNYSELGCTTDSLQYYTNIAGRVNYRWDLNLEKSATQGPNTASNVIYAHYLQDTATVGSYTSVRDAGLEQVQYGELSGSGTFAVAGTVDFLYHAPTASSGSNGQSQSWAVAYGTNYNCSTTPPGTTTSMRCDDPVAYGSQAAPATMSTLTLDTIETFVGSDYDISNFDYSYALTYNQDTPYALCTDPITFVTLTCAGEHTLASITPSAYLGTGTPFAQQPTVFTYTTRLADTYYDSSRSPVVSVGSDWQYLASYDDEQTGVGEKISYGLAYNNTHGTPELATDNRYDPRFCIVNAATNPCTGSYAYADDKAWSVQVVTQIQNRGKDSSSGSISVATTNYAYSLAKTGTGCPSATFGSITDTDCVGNNWIPASDGNWTNYYDGEFRGFAAVDIISPAGDLTVDHYASTEGWGTSPTDADNYLTGTPKDEEVYSGSSASGPLLQKTINTYAGDDHGGSDGSCDTAVTGEYPACENVLLYHSVYTYNGTTGSNAPWAEQDFYYDDYGLTTGLAVGHGHYHNLTEEDYNGSNVPSTYHLWTYSPNDQDTGGVTYYDVNKVTESQINDPNGHIWDCTVTNYDEGVASGVPTPAAGWATKVQTYSSANCNGQTSPITRDYTGYDAYGNKVVTVDSVGTANKPIYSSVGCSASPTYMTSSFSSYSHYTTCTVYDDLGALPVTQTNVLNQASSTAYDTSQQDQPTSVTDANGQTATASYSYDSSGNPTVQIKQPLETGTYTSQSTEISNCTTTSTLPCFEEDTNSSFYSSAVSRTFYDSEGRAVETRTPGPTSGDDTIVMTVYNDQLHTTWKSVAFEVTSGSSWIDPNGATDINGNAPAGTVTYLDALGRTIAVRDPNFGSTQEPGISCSTTLSGAFTSCANYSWGTASGTTDTKYYESVTSIDPNGHVAVGYSDALGESIYGEVNSGVYGGTLTLQKLTTMQYNPIGKPTSIVVTDEAPQTGQSITSVTTTATYDDLGRQLTLVDPDQGTFTTTYDPDGHVSSVVQTSGSSTRTLGYNYDLLGRVGCEQTAAPTFNTTGTCSAGSTLLKNTYDSTQLGTQGSTDFPIGHLTQSIATTYYPDSSSATVTQQYQTDARGRTIATQMQLGLPSGWNVTTSLPTYQLAASYNDANQVTTTTATAGTASYSFSPVYDATTGSLEGLSSGTSGSSANLATLAYNEYAQLSGLTLLNGSSMQVASMQYSYDGDQRPTSLTTNWLPGSGNSGEILGGTRTYDNASNVTSTSTFFASVPGASGSGGSEVQNFCYDSLNRLIWSGNGGTQPGAGNGTCGSGTLASGLIGAGYTAPYTYTNLGQIWQGPLNGTGTNEQYLYCSSSHPHQLTGIYPTGTTCSSLSGAVYTASYDAWGNETSRTYNSTTATLSYDALNRLTEYNAGSSSQEFYVYDASGNRVLKRSISGGTTTLTAYAYSLQELTYTSAGSFSSQIDYYSLAGHLIGSTDGSTTTYDLTDAQGSVLTTLSASAVLGEQTYGPYGNQRYLQGTMGTDKGYTGQFHDAVSGLDYYNARYYDPVMGQFLSADHVQGNAQGMDPYSYVNGNPETATDPTGNCIADPNGGGCYRPPAPGGCPGDQVKDGNGNCSDPGPNINDCRADDSLQGCNKFSCAELGGPMSTNTCQYHDNGDCNEKTYNQCQQLHKEERARKDAMTAAGFFSNLNSILGNDWLDALFAAFGLALSMTDWALVPLIGAIVSGLSLAAAIIANMAAGLASLFANEGIDQSSGQLNNGWFTKANLEGNLSQIGGIVTGHMFAGGGTSLVMDLVYFFGAAFKGSRVVNGIGQGEAGLNTLKVGTVGVVVEVIAVAAGAIVLNQLADNYIQQEEADVA